MNLVADLPNFKNSSALMAGYFFCLLKVKYPKKEHLYGSYSSATQEFKDMGNSEITLHGCLREEAAVPWREVELMDEKVLFIADCLREGGDFSQLCSPYGISRKTGCKWLDRYRCEGLEGLEERSRRPHAAAGGGGNARCGSTGHP